MKKQMPVDVIPEGFKCFQILGSIKMRTKELNVKICPYLKFDDDEKGKHCEFLDGVEIFNTKECQINLGV